MLDKIEKIAVIAVSVLESVKILVELAQQLGD